MRENELRDYMVVAITSSCFGGPCGTMSVLGVQKAVDDILSEIARRAGSQVKHQNKPFQFDWRFLALWFVSLGIGFCFGELFF